MLNLDISWIFSRTKFSSGVNYQVTRCPVAFWIADVV